MTKPKTPVKPLKIANQYMVYEGINQINSVFGALTTLEAYINSDKFCKYQASLALDCIRTTLREGTMHIENWCELEEEVKP